MLGRPACVGQTSFVPLSVAEAEYAYHTRGTRGGARLRVAESLGGAHALLFRLRSLFRHRPIFVPERAMGGRFVLSGIP